MPDVTRLLEAAQAGDRKAAADLLPVVYHELRILAASRMSAEKPDHTLDATALVHEAYLRLVGDQQFDGGLTLGQGKEIGIKSPNQAVDDAHERIPITVTNRIACQLVWLGPYCRFSCFKYQRHLRMIVAECGVTRIGITGQHSPKFQ